MFDINTIAQEVQDGQICPQCYSPIEDGRCSSNCDLLGDWEDWLDQEESEQELVF